MTTKLPKLTFKQRQILWLLYQYRFLNRIQIQTFLKHKDYKTINLWLKDLRQKHYVEWIYSTDFAEKTKPAVYYLGINAIRLFREQGNYDESELRKRYRENTRSQTYIDRCLLIAHCCITLEQARDEKYAYYYETEADYLKDGFYHFLLDSELVKPNLCFSKDKYDIMGELHSIRHYLLEVFDPTLPRYRLKKRVADYVKYLDEEAYEWKENSDCEKLPIILLVCPRTTDLIYSKRRTRGLLADVWDDDDRKRMRIKFTTVEKLKKHGLLTKEIWEKA